MAFIAILLAFSIHSAQADQKQLREKKHHELVTYQQVQAWIRSPSSISGVLKRAGTHFSVASSRGNYFVLESKHAILPEEFEKLKKDPDIEALSRIHMLSLRRVESTPGCEVLPEGFSEVEATRELVEGLNGKCPITEICPKSGRDRLWAQRRVEADLMQKEIQKRNLRDPKTVTRVAILDTGFDPKRLPNLVNSNKLSFAPVIKHKDSYLELGDPKKDTGGHGTMVAGVIAGKNGMGVAPHSDVSVYRVTRQWSDTSTSQSALNESMLRACEEKKDSEGVTFLNLSWGGWGDESGISVDEDDPVFKKVLEEMASKGCIVVKAAGNSNFREARKSFNLDDPYLRVASTDATNALSDFSTLGEVSAPGSNVYTLASSLDYQYYLEDTDVCEEQDKSSNYGYAVRRFVNGTSFAAPLTAGLLSEMVGVLKTERSTDKNSFKNLTPPERISLVNRMAQACVMRGSLSGLCLVHVAEGWKQSSTAGVPSVKDLKSLREKGISPGVLAGCDQPVDQCQAKTSCIAVKGCYDQNRLLHAVCPKDSSARTENLLKTAAKNGNFDSAVGWLSQLGKSRSRDGLCQELVVQYFNGIDKLYGNAFADAGRYNDSSRLGAIPYTLDSNIARTLFPCFLSFAADNKTQKTVGQAKYLFKATLTSAGLRESLKKPVERGSAEDLQFVMKLIKDMSSIMGKDNAVNFTLKILKESLEREAKTHSGNTTYSISRDFGVVEARLINTLFEDSLYATNKDVLLAFEKNIYAKLDASKSEYASEKSEYGFTDYNLSRSFLDPMFERNKNLVKADLERDDIKKTAFVKLAWAFKNLDSVFPSGEDQEKLVFKALHAVSYGYSWNGGVLSKYQEEVTKKSILALQKLCKEKGADYCKGVREKFTTIVKNNINFSLLYALKYQTGDQNLWSKIYHYKYGYDKTKPETPADEFLNFDLMLLIQERMDTWKP